MRRFINAELYDEAIKIAGKDRIRQIFDDCYAEPESFASYEELESWWRNGIGRGYREVCRIVGCVNPELTVRTYLESLYAIIKEATGGDLKKGKRYTHHGYTKEDLKCIRALNRKYSRRRACHPTSGVRPGFVCYCDEK